MYACALRSAFLFLPSSVDERSEPNKKRTAGTAHTHTQRNMCARRIDKTSDEFGVSPARLVSVGVCFSMCGYAFVCVGVQLKSCLCRRLHISQEKKESTCASPSLCCCHH